jgi:sugar lactone lactonase YvrE
LGRLAEQLGPAGRWRIPIGLDSKSSQELGSESSQSVAGPVPPEWIAFDVEPARRAVKDLEAELVTGGFSIGEGPRWHQDRLWFSDIFDTKIYSFREDSGLNIEARVDRPSGLGWLPDGSLLVAILARPDGADVLGPALLSRVDTGRVQPFVELAERNTSFNDMVTLPSGRSYLNLYYGGVAGQDKLLLVEPNGTHRVVASDLSHPNGMAITPDGQTIILCETHSGNVTSFSIDADGGLFDRKSFASDLQLPDGLCLDAEGAVWVGCLFASEFLRIAGGGAVTHRVRVPSPYWALAPMLGGPDRRSLYLFAADTDPARALEHDSRGYVYSVRVDVPGAGWP